MAMKRREMTPVKLLGTLKVRSGLLDLQPCHLTLYLVLCWKHGFDFFFGLYEEHRSILCMYCAGILKSVIKKSIILIQEREGNGEYH